MKLSAGTWVIWDTSNLNGKNITSVLPLI